MAKRQLRLNVVPSMKGLNTRSRAIIKKHGLTRPPNQYLESRLTTSGYRQMARRGVARAWAGVAADRNDLKGMQKDTIQYNLHLAKLIRDGAIGTSNAKPVQKAMKRIGTGLSKQYALYRKKLTSMPALKDSMHVRSLAFANKLPSTGRLTPKGSSKASSKISSRLSSVRGSIPGSIRGSVKSSKKSSVATSGFATPAKGDKVFNAVKMSDELKKRLVGLAKGQSSQPVVPQTMSPEEYTDYNDKGRIANVLQKFKIGGAYSSEPVHPKSRVRSEEDKKAFVEKMKAAKAAKKAAAGK